MDARREGKPAPIKNPTTVERTSDASRSLRERSIARARLVFEAWTKPSCSGVGGAEVDGHVLAFLRDGCSRRGQVPFVFEPIGRRLRHLQRSHTALVPLWTNEEGGEGPVTTVTFAEQGGKTLVVLHEPTLEGSSMLPAPGRWIDGEMFVQLDERLSHPGRERRGDASSEGYEGSSRRSALDVELNIGSPSRRPPSGHLHRRR